MPTRIQLKRGQPLPPGAKWVTRISRWGNEYKLIEHGGTYTREESLMRYRRDVEAMQEQARMKWLAPLGELKYLACSCALDEPCHADVLIEFLNASA